MKHLIEKALVAATNATMSANKKNMLVVELISSYINASIVCSGISATVVDTLISDDFEYIGTKDMVMDVIINHSNDAVIDFNSINPLNNGGMIIPLIFVKVEEIKNETYKYVFFMPQVREYVNLIILCLLNLLGNILSNELNSTLSISEDSKTEKELCFKIDFKARKESFIDDKLLSDTIIESLDKLLKRQFYPNGYYNLSSSYSRSIKTSGEVIDGVAYKSITLEFTINEFDSKLAINSMWKAIIKHSIDKERYLKEKVYVA